MKRTIIFTVLVICVAIIGTTIVMARSTAYSGAPALISYQGFLTDSNDDPIADGTYAMKFALYDAGTGGNKIWEETQNSVTVANGFFAVLLGNGSCSTGCPLDAGDFDSPTRYLQASVDTGGGFVDFPRQQLASVPYALQAQVAASASWNDLTDLPAGFADNTDDIDDTVSFSEISGIVGAGNQQVAAGDHNHDDRYYTETELQTGGSASVHWDNLSNVPPGFADGTDDGASYENVIVVAKSGGDFTSVKGALDETVSASADNRYLVLVAPGVYTETELLQVRGHVHLKGYGPNVSVIKSSRSSSSPNNDAATVELQDSGRISDLHIINDGTGTFGIAIYSATPTTRAAIVDNVVAEANGSGGTGHYAVYLNDAEPTIQNSILKASGATGFGTGVNAALGSVNISGGFPQALVVNSQLMGGSDTGGIACAGNTGTGFGLQLTNSSPTIRHSYICGDHRGIFVGNNGNVQVQNSHIQVSSTGGAFLFETTSSGSVLVANSGVFYVGNKFTGTGSLVCAHAYKANYTPAVDSTSSATACD